MSDKLTREEIEAGLKCDLDNTPIVERTAKAYQLAAIAHRALRELAAIRDAVDAERMSDDSYDNLSLCLFRASEGLAYDRALEVDREAKRARLTESSLRAELSKSASERNAELVDENDSLRAQLADDQVKYSVLVHDLDEEVGKLRTQLAAAEARLQLAERKLTAVLGIPRRLGTHSTNDIERSLARGYNAALAEARRVADVTE